MKTKRLLALGLILCSLLSVTINASEFKVEKETVIAISKYISAGASKSEDGSAGELAKILASDEAIQGFSQMVVELCQNPQKFDFPAEGIDKAECTQEKVFQRVQADLAYTLLDTFHGEVAGDKVESYLNNFLNTYLEKMKAVIEAFNSWM